MGGLPPEANLIRRSRRHKKRCEEKAGAGRSKGKLSNLLDVSLFGRGRADRRVREAERGREHLRTNERLYRAGQPNDLKKKGDVKRGKTARRGSASYGGATRGSWAVRGDVDGGKNDCVDMG